MRQLGSSEWEIFSWLDRCKAHLLIFFNRLVDRLVDRSSALFFRFCRDSFPSPLGAVFLEAPGVGERPPALDTAVGDAHVHDLKDFSRLPLLGLVIGVIQRFLVELLGAELIPVIGFHEAVDLPGSGILLHVFLLLRGLLLLHLPGQVDAVFSRFIDRHDLCPHQVDIGAGGFFICQDMRFCLLRMHLHRKEAAVAASVHGQEIHFVGGASKHTLPQMIGSVAVIGKLVGILAPGEKGPDVLDALGICRRYHLRHFHDPVSCQSLIDLFIVQLFQVIGKPFVPDSQEAKERRFPCSLTAGQHQHQIKFRSRLKDSLHICITDPKGRKCRVIGNMNGRAARELAADHPLIIPYTRRLNTIDQYVRRGTLDEELTAVMKKLAKDKKQRALADLAYAKGPYLQEIEQNALKAEAQRMLA